MSSGRMRVHAVRNAFINCDPAAAIDVGPRGIITGAGNVFIGCDSLRLGRQSKLVGSTFILPRYHALEFQLGKMCVIVGHNAERIDCDLDIS